MVVSALLVLAVLANSTNSMGHRIKAAVLLAALAVQGLLFAAPRAQNSSQVTITLVRWPFT